MQVAFVCITFDDARVKSWSNRSLPFRKVHEREVPLVAVNPCYQQFGATDVGQADKLATARKEPFHKLPPAPVEGFTITAALADPRNDTALLHSQSGVVAGR